MTFSTFEVVQNVKNSSISTPQYFSNRASLVVYAMALYIKPDVHNSTRTKWTLAGIR